MNLNPRAKRILCYGDSYTWGYTPDSNHERFPANQRWTGILQASLGNDYEVIEEGLNSRTLISDDIRPGKEGRNGRNYLIPCLDTHDPIDLVILMLGTNELKDVYGVSADKIGEIIENGYVKTVLGRRSQFQNTYPKLVLVSPPIIDIKTDYAKARYSQESFEKNTRLAKIYEDVATRNDCSYFDSSTIENVGKDGVHLNKDGHKKLGIKLGDLIKEMDL